MKYILKLTLVAIVFSGLVGVTLPVVTSAAPALPVTTFAQAITCKNGEKHPVNYQGKPDDKTCCPTDSANPPTGKSCLFDRYINPLVALLSALVGIVVVGSVIFAGIQYSASAGDPGKAAAAKSRITNSLLALAAFIFMFAFLQWLIPGGLKFS
ncbi:MAG TPA: hypothetical protein VD735_03815 [Candidatus Saccharimonadales bacterium]|nr:hypothetical protein [Candidatus Saccharimonadales bacterium]